MPAISHRSEKKGTFGQGHGLIYLNVCAFVRVMVMSWPVRAANKTQDLMRSLHSWASLGDNLRYAAAAATISQAYSGVLERAPACLCRL